MLMTCSSHSSFHQILKWQPKAYTSVDSMTHRMRTNTFKFNPDKRELLGAWGLHQIKVQICSLFMQEMYSP